MTNVIEYQMQYEMYLAEEELFESMIHYEATSLTESAGLYYIHEGFKETIMNYISKIAKALENAWLKFKEIITKGLEKIKLIDNKKMQNPDPQFTITNCPEYDESVLEMDVVPFNYEQMKDDLESSEKFIQKYYARFIKDPAKSLKDNICDAFVKAKQDIKCTPDIMKNMFQKLKTVTGQLFKVEKDLKSMNDSNKNIQAMTAQITPETTATGESAFYEFFIFLEDGEENNGKTGYQDNPEAADKKSNNNSSIVKHITTYMKVSSEVISAKMKCFKDQFMFYLQTVLHYIKPSKNNEGENKEENKEQGSANVDIEINT